MKKINIIAASTILITTLFAGTTQAGYIEPGSELDPVVTQSYVDKKFDEIKKDSISNKGKIEQLEKDIEGISKDSGNNNQITADVFKVVELKKGQTLTAGESTEIIIRSGNVTAIASKNGGISDITQGKDLQTGDKIDLNHLLIIPRSDGRGIEVNLDGTFIMIKGKYEIE